MNLEDKLTRLKEIQQLLTNGKVNLTESMKLLEEAMKLKKEIDVELKQLENTLISLSKEGEVLSEEKN
jgi:exodeoxyribonuclease VII small subunit